MRRIDEERKSLSDTIPEGRLALDSSVLVEILNGTELGSRLTERVIARRIVAHSSFVNVAEAEYIVCRKLGHSAGRRKIEDLLGSEYVALSDAPSLHAIASRLKCERAISLPDCYTFAVAEATSSRPVFAFRERDLLKEIDRRPFDVEPLFLA